MKKKGEKPQYQVYGIHAVAKALQAGRVTAVFYDAQRQDKRLSSLLAEVAAVRISPRAVERKQLTILAAGMQHQGVVADVEALSMKSEQHLEAILQAVEQPFFLVLDQVQDPHNLGACLRTAYAAGVDAVITPKDRAVGMTPVVYKTASGAAEFIPLIQVTNLSRTLKDLKSAGIWLVGTSDQAPKTLFEQALTGPIAIVMGAEGSGMRKQTAAQCDHLISIPMLGQVESLNVSVATGVVLYERLRQLSVG